VAPQHAMRKSVERANPQVLHGYVQKRLDPVPHFGSSFVGERHCQQAMRRDAINVN